MTPDHIIFIDWDGTLSCGRFWSSLPEKEYQSIQRALFAENGPLVIEWMLGKKSSEDVCAWLSAATGIDREALLAGLKESCVRMGISPVTRELLGRIRNTHRVILVTDNMDCFTRFTVPAHSLAEAFDRIMNSADVGRMKNHDGGRTFKDAAAAFGVPLAHSAIIDDSAAACETVSALGGRPLRTAGPEHTAELLQALAVEAGAVA